MSNFKIDWIDGGREPQCSPDPAFPDGKHLGAPPGVQCCKVCLPYPARRCGMYYVECKACGTNVLITTAGRPDDPRSVHVPCLPKTLQ
jgi:hypothetical protein